MRTQGRKHHEKHEDRCKGADGVGHQAWFEKTCNANAERRLWSLSTSSSFNCQKIGNRFGEVFRRCGPRHRLQTASQRAQLRNLVSTHRTTIQVFIDCYSSRE